MSISLSTLRPDNNGSTCAIILLCRVKTWKGFNHLRFSNKCPSLEEFLLYRRAWCTVHRDSLEGLQLNDHWGWAAVPNPIPPHPWRLLLLKQCSGVSLHWPTAKLSFTDRQTENYTKYWFSWCAVLKIMKFIASLQRTGNTNAKLTQGYKTEFGMLSIPWQ